MLQAEDRMFPRKMAEQRLALLRQLQGSERILIGDALIVGVQAMPEGAFDADSAQTFCGQALTSRTGSPLPQPMPVRITLADEGVSIETWTDPESVEPDMVLAIIGYQADSLGTVH